MTSFTSMEFLFRFFPIFLVVYYLVPSKHRTMVLLLGSVIFYAVGEPVFIGLLLALTVLNYLLGNQIWRLKGGYERKEWQKKGQKKFLILAVGIDLAVLVTFKTLGVFGNRSLLPLGISFYLFKMISYQADLYRNEIISKPGWKDTAAYFILFPQIAQGPIMRYEEGRIYDSHHYSLENFEDGLKYFILGLSMKVLLADRLAILWNDLQMIGFQSISTPLAWLGAIGYSLRLYLDFWGYSLMASGIMVMLGFDFIENFHHPYAARSISEFYRRWHMTLGSWFRDYVYFPMGGSRCSKKKMVGNLLLVWFLTGLWHGEKLNYLLWGGILGLLIVGEKLLYGKYLDKIPVLGNIYIIVLIPITWVLFAIEEPTQLLTYFGRLFPLSGNNGIAVHTLDFVKYAESYGVFFILGILLCIPAVSDFYEKHKNHPVVSILLMLLFWVSIYFVAGSSGNPFMYLNF